MSRARDPADRIVPHDLRRTDRLLLEAVREFFHVHFEFAPRLQEASPPCTHLRAAGVARLAEHREPDDQRNRLHRQEQRRPPRGRRSPAGRNQAGADQQQRQGRRNGDHRRQRHLFVLEHCQRQPQRCRHPHAAVNRDNTGVARRLHQHQFRQHGHHSALRLVARHAARREDQGRGEPLVGASGRKHQHRRRGPISAARCWGRSRSSE